MKCYVETKKREENKEKRERSWKEIVIVEDKGKKGGTGTTKFYK